MNAQRAIRILLAGAILAAAWTVAQLVIPVIAPQPTVITDTFDDGSVRWTLDRPITGADGCLTASWEVAGVQAVYLGWWWQPQEDVTTLTAKTVCIENDSYMTFDVVDTDGNRYGYRADVYVSNGRAAPVYALLVVGMVAFAAWLVWPFGAQLGGGALPRYAVWLGAIVLAGVVVALYAPAKYIVYGGDYEVHVYYSYQIATGAPLTSPHFINQFLTIAAAWMLPGNEQDSYFDAQFIVNTTFLVLTAWAFGAYLLRAGGRPTTWRALVGYGALTLGVMLAAPIFFPTLHDHELFFGYIGTSNMFHNPTYTLMRPMSLLLVWVTLRLFDDDVPHRAWVTVAGAALTVLSLITKPNHVIIWVPAVGLALLWVLWHERRIRWTPVLVVAAAFPVLAVQFLGFFTDADAERFTEPSRVIFAPLAAVMTRESSYGWMLAKTLLSSAFPLAVTALYWPRTRRSRTLNVTGLAYAVGLLYAYLLAEQGKIQHANFIFSAQIGLDMWFIAAVAWLLHERPPRDDARWPFVVALLGLHIAAGVVWHAINVTSGYPFVWWGRP
jgi:hypothetical protein